MPEAEGRGFGKLLFTKYGVLEDEQVLEIDGHHGSQQREFTIEL